MHSAKQMIIACIKINTDSNIKGQINLSKVVNKNDRNLIIFSEFCQIKINNISMFDLRKSDFQKIFFKK